MNVRHVHSDRVDVAIDRLFTQLSTAVRIGDRTFPTLASYWDLVSRLSTDADPAELVAQAQRNWHVRGQNGCGFARMVALSSAELRWDSLVFGSCHLDYDALAWLTEKVDACVDDPHNELLSLLFPSVGSGAGVIQLLDQLATATSFWMEREVTTEHDRRFCLRYPIGTDGVHAWVMAFGPFDFMPNTRRSPYFELVLRTKAKPKWIFHRLNHDRGVAHLADAPLTMPDSHWEHRWRSTRRRTRMILGGEPDELTAAKMTFSIPLDAV